MNSDTQITTTVPSGATSGPFSVTTPAGTATNAASFIVIPSPTITSFTPTSGPVGSTVVVIGSGLSGATAVTVDGVPANFTVRSDTEIIASMPAGVTSDPISVTTPGGTATSSICFTVIVTPKLTLTVSGPRSGSMKLGKALTATGSVTPANLDGGKVRLVVQRKRDGVWLAVMSLTPTFSPSGSCSWIYKPAEKGSYRIMATIAAAATKHGLR